MSMAWIDYRKAFDSVPHNCIIKSLESFKGSPIIVNFLKSNMRNGKTILSLSHKSGNLKSNPVDNAVFFKEIPYLLYFFVLFSFL